MDLEIASHCVGPRTRDYLSKRPHHVLPCMNLQRVFPVEENKDFMSESFQNKISWRLSMPIPITPPVKTTHEALNGIDQTTSLIRDKIKWQMRKNKILHAVKKDKKNISEKSMMKAEKSEVDTTTDLPRGLALLARHLDEDPDPQFSGVYNWYYAGGTLATVESNGENHLLYANQSTLNCAKYKMDGTDGSNTELLFSLNLEQQSPIYQIVSNSVVVGTRQKSYVNLFATVESDDKLSLSRIHSVSDKRDPFLSVALRKKSNKKFCTLSTNGILKLWDVEYSKGYKIKLQVKPGEGVNVMDSWGSVQYVDSRTLLLADRCCIHLFDTRMDMREKLLAWCPRKLSEQCEQLSCVLRSQVTDQVVYTTTTHQVFSLDLRIGFHQRWTHMMSAPPYVGFTQVLDQNQECLCIGSQVMADCVTIVNRWSGDDPVAECRPMRLPSPFQGLLSARQHGLCLDPALNQRCNQSMTGLTCLPFPNGLHVARQSATGDVFIQQLVSVDDSLPSYQLTDNELKAYSDWSKPTSVCQQETTPVSVSDVKNFTPVLEALIDTYPLEELPASGACSESGGWRRSKQYLEDCIDLLAPKLLSVWEVEDEEEWQCEEEETLVEQDPAEKVQNWLQAGNTTFADQTLADMTSLKPKVSSTPYVLPVVKPESPTESLEGVSQWIMNAEQTVPRTPSTPQTHRPTTNLLFSPPSDLSPTSGSDRPSRKKRKLLYDTVTVTNKQPDIAAKKPATSSAKKKFIPGF